MSIPTEPDESEDLMTHWQNFIEGGGDSTIDLLNGLDDALLSKQPPIMEVQVASFLDEIQMTPGFHGSRALTTMNERVK